MPPPSTGRGRGNAPRAPVGRGLGPPKVPLKRGKTGENLSGSTIKILKKMASAMPDSEEFKQNPELLAALFGGGKEAKKNRVEKLLEIAEKKLQKQQKANPA